MKVADLTGDLLDYWVAKALGHNVVIFADSVKVLDWQKPGSIVRGNPFQPSDSWAQGGPIIQHERIHITWDGFVCGAMKDHISNDAMLATMQEGKTPLIAAMRSYVSSVFGDAVPDEVTP